MKEAVKYNVLLMLILGCGIAWSIFIVWAIYKLITWIITK